MNGTSKDPCELSATQAARLIASRKLSALELIQACLERIRGRDSTVRAWTLIDRKKALAQARECDEALTKPETRPGPLFGVPVGVKDIIDTSGLITSYGSPIYRNHLPRRNAAAVARMIGAGAIELGKTVATEFAYRKPGKTANPHNPLHTPGGSSSGSAAAVADFQVPLAIGTQTSGSVIRPAAYCGVVGFKPSHGAIERTGVRPLAASLDTVGLFARDVADLRLLFDAVRVPREQSPQPEAHLPPRLGHCRTPHWTAAESGTRQAMERAAARLADAGAEVTVFELPPEFIPLNEAHAVIMAVDAARTFAEEMESHHILLSRPLRDLIERGQSVDHARDIIARTLSAACRERFDRILAPLDALIVPAAPGEAPPGLGGTGDPVFNKMWTLLHLPCISLPAGRGRGDLPLAIQLVANRGRDDRLLQIAAWAEGRIAG
ncbi:MAG: amidase [Alphaproteobacteria bacterium]|nr:amidase [Alphaproteobacteria bacterium]